MNAPTGAASVADAPDWYRDAVIYELHVRAFADSSADGIGDFRGLVEKLDYLHDLGVTAIWLLPFYPSPLRDDGYDTADYRAVNPAYGQMRDFQAFVRAAHDRGLRVITELVINHTSDQHPWFQRARRSPAGSRWRNFYVWSESPERYRDARIIFNDFETSNWSWDALAGQYYWHRFYAHQPDLNFQSADVRRAVFRLVDFWLRLGVDGLRLDAVPYLYEREGTTCENLEETHGFLRELRRHVDSRFPSRLLLAEANQWPEDAARYFGEGDECHMAFHFPLMPRLFMAIQMEDRFPIIDILHQTPPIPRDCQWALFLRNHDELTLEMVTDEERDYMYRVYAHEREARINLGIRRRLAPLLGNDRAKIELMNGLLLSLPGTPVIYYGDEIGMGDNIYLGDRDGVRTPMQWSGDRNAGFSRANPQRLFLPTIIDPEFHYETINVETQADNPQSLLWWMRRVLALRKRYPVFGRGELEFLHPENRRVLAYLRRGEGQVILIAANLSRFAQYVELDLSEFKGSAPVELFGHTVFPRIGDLPYLLTLGPHAVYWLAIEGPPSEEGAEGMLPTIAAPRTFDTLFSGRAAAALEAALARHLPGRRWFAGKARVIRGVTLSDALPVTGSRAGLAARVAIVEVDFAEGEPETYAVPIALLSGERADRQIADFPGSIIARVEIRGQSAILCDALADPDFCMALLDMVRRRRRLRGAAGALSGSPTHVMRATLADPALDLEPRVSRAEQSNSSIIYGSHLILKLFRRIERGVNPDLEVGRQLAEDTRFWSTPGLAGALEYRGAGSGEAATLAIVHQFIPGEGDAWSYTVDALGLFYERMIADRHIGEQRATGGGALAQPPASLLARARQPVPAEADELIGSYLGSARLLGQRTAELHEALARGSGAAFAPEATLPHHHRGAYQSMRTLTARAMGLLRASLPALGDRERFHGERVLGAEGQILERFRGLLERRIASTRIRCHGDYHLGQVLYTGRDFLILDFEGEPARSLSERRAKRSPMRDVAGMLRSYRYATFAALFDESARGLVEPESEGLRDMEEWGRYWYAWVSGSFLGAYLEAADGASFLPAEESDLGVLLETSLLEKAVYELGYELNSRPDWALIPLLGIEELLGAHVTP